MSQTFGDDDLALKHHMPATEIYLSQRTKHLESYAQSSIAKAEATPMSGSAIYASEVVMSTSVC